MDQIVKVEVRGRTVMIYRTGMYSANVYGDLVSYDNEKVTVKDPSGNLKTFDARGRNWQDVQRKSVGKLTQSNSHKVRHQWHTETVDDTTGRLLHDKVTKHKSRSEHRSSGWVKWLLIGVAAILLVLYAPWLKSLASAIKASLAPSLTKDFDEERSDPFPTSTQTETFEQQELDHRQLQKYPKCTKEITDRCQQ